VRGGWCGPCCCISAPPPTIIDSRSIGSGRKKAGLAHLGDLLALFYSSAAGRKSRCGIGADASNFFDRCIFNHPMKITATIITLNEERNIARAIESLRCCDQIVVLDSGSVDRTVELAQKLGAVVLEDSWRGYANQKNRAAEQAENDWISRSTPTKA